MLHNISIHTSAREVTLHLSQFHSCYLFQSTLLQGKWRIKALKSFSDVISIHTSAREVTGGKVFIKRPLRNFNPHFRKGSDHSNLDGLWPYGIFQSTLPQGKWRPLDDLLETAEDFNPHFRKGSDRTHGTAGHGLYHFNPHFRKGSDYTGQRRRAGHRISIHTSAREVTTHCTKWRRSLSISIHTSAREVTAISCRTGGEHGNFNPHFRKGSD